MSHQPSSLRKSAVAECTSMVASVAVCTVAASSSLCVMLLSSDCSAVGMVTSAQACKPRTSSGSSLVSKPITRRGRAPVGGMTGVELVGVVRATRRAVYTVDGPMPSTAVQASRPSPPSTGCSPAVVVASRE